MAQSKFGELIKSDTPTFVDFSAEWCGPCKMMTPILEDLKSKVGDQVKIVKIDIDRNPGLATAYQIQSVPTMMLFKNGNTLWRQSGVMTSEQLRKVIDLHTS